MGNRSKYIMIVTRLNKICENHQRVRHTHTHTKTLSKLSFNLRGNGDL